MDPIYKCRPLRCAMTFSLALNSLLTSHLPGVQAEGVNADESSWYSRELPGLAEYYFGWFGAVRASQEGIVFTGRDPSLEIGGIHDPRKPKTESSIDWILESGTEVTVPLGARVYFIHAEAVRFELTPLSGEFEKWGFMAMFRARVRLRGDPVVDRALILLLRERDGPGRRICVLPNDLELARQIVADGGYVPEGATTSARGVFVVGDRRSTTGPDAGDRTGPIRGSSIEGTPTAPAITTNTQTEPQSEGLSPALVASKTRWCLLVAAVLLLVGTLFKILRK